MFMDNHWYGIDLYMYSRYCLGRKLWIS